MLGIEGGFIKRMLTAFEFGLGPRVLPHKALSNGFKFRHENLRSAFEAIL